MPSIIRTRVGRRCFFYTLRLLTSASRRRAVLELEEYARRKLDIPPRDSQGVDHIVSWEPQRHELLDFLVGDVVGRGECLGGRLRCGWLAGSGGLSLSLLRLSLLLLRLLLLLAGRARLGRRRDGTRLLTYRGTRRARDLWFVLERLLSLLGDVGLAEERYLVVLDDQLVFGQVDARLVPFEHVEALETLYRLPLHDGEATGQV